MSLSRAAHRYERFDPVTIRAAARVICLGRNGRLSQAEVVCYLEHLADMDPYARLTGYGPLLRVARRWASMGHTGVVMRLGRTSRPVREMDHCPLPATSVA